MEKERFDGKSSDNNLAIRNGAWAVYSEPCF